MDIELNLNTELVSEAEPSEPTCVEPGTTLREVLLLLKEHDTGSLLICEQGILKGIFTERDALRLMAQGQSLDVPIEQVMVRNPVTVGPDATVRVAIDKMFQGGYRRLPIVDEANRPVGMLKVSGIVHYLVEHFPGTIYNQPPVPQPITQEREGA